MRLRNIVICIALALISQAAFSAKPEFTILISTNRTTVWADENVAGQTPQPDKTEKSLTFVLSSPKEALPTALAEVWPPESAGLGEKIVLAVDTSSGTKQPPDLLEDVQSLKMRIYWGTSASVKSGQPRLLSWKDFPDSFKEAVKPEGRRNQGSVARWNADAGTLQRIARLAGQYRLMSYAGSAEITLDSQEFLPEVEITSPAGQVKGTQPIEVVWKRVPGALAYFVTAHAVSSDQTIVGWTSGDNPDAPKSAAVDKYVNDKQIAALIKRGILLSPDTLSCTIPAAAFEGADSIMIVVTAYGVDKEVDGKEVRACAIVRSVGKVVRDVE